MRQLSLPLACLSTLLLAPALGVSQSQSRPAANRTPALVSELASDTQGGSCPVHLDVRHGSGLGQVVATDQFSLKPATQRLDVTVHNNELHAIASIDVLVQMRSGKARPRPLLMESDELGEKLPIHFAHTIETNKEVDTDWNVASLNAVAYLEISKVTYQDGSVWQAPKGSLCQFTPNPMMLISER